MHKEERKDIQLELGDVSWEKELGSYYIDMRPALVHYTDNIYNGGLDEESVPYISKPDGTHAYFPINIAQFGFIKHANYLETKDTKELKVVLSCLEKLEKLKTEDDREAIWWHDYKEVKYNIEPKWASAMAQGEVISLYLRVYQITGNDDLLQTAQKAFNFMLRTDEKGVKRFDKKGYAWLEEYPSQPCSYVLNGFIYAIWGIMDLYRVTGDETVKKELDAYLLTLKENVHQFDSGYWSYYDLLKKELVRYYYQKNVHAPQLKVMYKLTNEIIYRDLANKWESQLGKLNFLFVQIMYRVLPRYRKLKKAK